MTVHAHAENDLTRNQSLVLDTLSQSGGPLSAYTILDQLRDHGFRAPLQVYRALDKLVEFGMVHRLESLMHLWPVVTPVATTMKPSRSLSVTNVAGYPKSAMIQLPAGCKHLPQTPVLR